MAAKSAEAFCTRVRADAPTIDVFDAMSWPAQRNARRRRPNAITFLSHRETQSLDESGSPSEPRFNLCSGIVMKIFGALALVILVLAPIPARAESRGTDAALGAVSGALVFGPVGAVAGAVVGFTAGPAIGSSWGVNGRQRARYRGRTQSRQMQSRTAPTVQGGETVNRSGQASAPPIPADNAVASAQARMPTPSANVPAPHAKAPPVQGFE
jgi:hypothetical protein